MTKFNSDYVQFCTSVENQDFTSIGARLSLEKNIRLVHAAIGISTEITELIQALSNPSLDVVNIAEEIGDVLWYVAIASDTLKILPDLAGASSDLTQIAKNEDTKILAFDSLMTLQMKSGEFLDKTKKIAFYGKNISNEEMSLELNQIVVALIDFAAILKIDLNNSVEANTKKLSARYKGGFSNDKANQRDLKTERSILESSL